MVYYPKSKYTPNLYSAGDLAYKDSKVPYNGYYFQTVDGKTFTGRYPGDGNNVELESLSNNLFNTAETFEDNNPEDPRFYPENAEYSALKKVTFNRGISQTPEQYYPQLTSQDYELGEIQRYFAKKSNENVFYETRALIQNIYYISFSLPWTIAGVREQVYNTNKSIVELKEQNFNAFGLGAFLKGNYLQFYK
jgi:hypothetical protein